MKAAVHTTYGPPDSLHVQETEKPLPGDDEVLIRVYAATVNRTDCHLLTGKPLYMRLFAGFSKPKLPITGTDFAGQIEAKGKNIRSLKVGQRVIGFEFLGLRSHADYLTISEKKELVIIPDTITYEQAAACIEGAFYALNVINTIKPGSGQKALVIGATGAIGSSYVQFLKNAGCSVTAVCGVENSELVKSIGADKIIDYRKEDFTKLNERFDFIFDAVDQTTFALCKPLLKKNGLFNSSGGLINIFLSMISPLTGGKKVVFVAPKDPGKHLNQILELVALGKFKPVIDRKYSLDEIAAAFSYVMSGQKIGNVIILMNEKR